MDPKVFLEFLADLFKNSDLLPFTLKVLSGQIKMTTSQNFLILLVDQASQVDSPN